MTPERYAIVGELYHQALARPREQRARFLDEACRSDLALRDEVATLLAAHDSAPEFIETPAIAVAAAHVAATHRPLVAGATIGHYEVQALIGRGGMGVVYRAHDSRLGRDVALKILPVEFARDEQRLARFRREAKVLASLNHPHIGSIYGIEEADGATALVMELVEGDDLSTRLSRGPLPLAEALNIARQIAEAIEAAHDRDLVHRDLKPANIKVRRDGTVKVLDFGLARPSRVVSDGATLAMMTTDAGMIIGTPAYMSPEQARGEVAEAQSDIWSFGVVLYELLSGVSPFARESSADTIASVLGTPVDMAALPAATPASVRRLIRRCLERVRKRRYRHMGDVRIEIEEALAGGESHAQEPSRSSPRSQRRWWGATGVVSLIVASAFVVATTLHQRVPATGDPVRFTVPPPDGGMFLTPVISGSGVPVGGNVSPNGRRLAFTAKSAAGGVQLWVRPIDSLESRALAGTDGAALPFWSPDSQAIAFFTPGKLKRITMADGNVQTLCDISRGRGGSWSPGGSIVFSGGLSTPLSQIDADGGAVRPLTALAQGERSHRFPSFLPDGRRFLYYAEDVDPTKSGIYLASLDSPAGRRLVAADSGAVYASGHLLFARQKTLFAQPFDVDTLQVRGRPASVAPSVPDEDAAPGFSASSTGVLTYHAGPQEDQQFAWFDRDGTLINTIGPPGNYRGIDLSPDGTRIAVHRHDGAGGDIWVIEPGGTLSRITFNPARDNAMPVWSPDGSRIAFGSLRNGKWGLYRKRADETPEDELLIESEAPKIPSSWSPDSQRIIYWSFSQVRTAWVLHLRDGSGPASTAPLLKPPLGATTHAQISPDGKWVAYLAADTGQLELYVRAFPDGNEQVRITTGGAFTPRWSRAGHELFYTTSYDDGTIVSVPYVIRGTQFVPGTPRELFKVKMVLVPHSTAIAVFHTYAVSPDAKRFLIPRPVSAFRGVAAPPIVVVLNWTAALP